MSDHRVTEFLDREVIHETVLSHPALDGLRVSGFLLSDDRRACIVLTPVEGMRDRFGRTGSDSPPIAQAGHHPPHRLATPQPNRTAPTMSEGRS